MHKKQRIIRPARNEAGHRSATRGALLPALIATGAWGLAATPAAALQLGELEVNSNLGQPLRASIAFALSPNEQLQNYCIFLKPAAGGAAMPALTSARLTVANGRINIAGAAPLNEPIASLGIAIDCPYTANLTRDYTLMVDPAPVTAPAVRYAAAEPARPLPAARGGQPAVAQAATPASTATPPTSVTPRPSAPVAAASAPTAPIAAGTAYRVQAGDSLSGIASRVEDRNVGLWPAVEQIFAANPDAFVGGNIDRLKAGATLDIPAFGHSESAAGDRVALAEPTPARSGTAYAGFTAPAQNEPVVQADFAVAEAAEATPQATTLDVASADSPALAQAVVLPATPAPAEAVTEPPAERRITRVEPLPGARPDAANWSAASSSNSEIESPASATPWMWFAGGALFGGLLAFVGVRLRRTPPAPEPAPRYADDDPTQENEIIDLHNLDATATGRQPMLDADLDSGAGFDDVEVAEDFGFSTTRDLGAALDVDLSEVAAGGLADTGQRRRRDDASILLEEIPPQRDDVSETGQYDLSMVVDATRQRFQEEWDDTAKDLKAVAEDKAPAATEETAVLAADDIVADATAENPELTIEQERDFAVLEQDYEDELSATQILEKEVLKASAELQESIGRGTVDDEALTSEQTAILSESTATSLLDENALLASSEENEDEVAADDLTAVIPSAREESKDIDDTIAETEITETLSVAENDDTAALSESGLYRTGKFGG